MKSSVLLLTPLLLYAEAPDRVSQLVETMREQTFAGDLAAVGRTVPILIGELAKPHPNAGLAWNQIGVYQAMQGNYAEAERVYQHGIRLLEQSGKTGDVALLQLNLGELYLDVGRPGQAEALLRRALTLATTTIGADAPELANYIYVLGVSRMQQGAWEDARHYFERALTLAGETRDGKIRRGIILGNLAVLYGRDKQWRQAKDSMFQAVPLLEQNLASGHPDLIPLYINLAAIHEHFKEWDLACSSLEKARAVAVTRLRPDHPYMPAILNAQAEIWKKLGNRSEAKELSRRARAIAAAQPRDPSGESSVHISDLKK
ncbi:MAG TPA: tetratricopeptide repeat protein [Bryobacteraceae bacterium]|nr:tetratricopeptide repeat protein [Bryobacteraceae bacterium]